jgi:hypothetical protein
MPILYLPLQQASYFGGTYCGVVHPPRCVTKCNNRIKLEHSGLQRHFDQLRRFPEMNILYAPLLTMHFSTEFMSSIFSQITQILAEYKNKPKEQS